MEKQVLRSNLKNLVRDWERNKNNGDHITQGELAAQVGVSWDAINRLYNNDFKRIDSATIEKVCLFFGCTVGELLELKPVEG